jgi:hypothetical protein
MAGESIRITGGPAAGSQIEIGQELQIGRSAGAEGRLGDDPEISRQHARFTRNPQGQLVVEDLGSTNGTYVNGQRIAGPQALGPGDSVQMGRSTLSVEGGAAADQGPTAFGVAPVVPPGGFGGYGAPPPPPPAGPPTEATQPLPAGQPAYAQAPPPPPGGPGGYGPGGYGPGGPGGPPPYGAKQGGNNNGRIALIAGLVLAVIIAAVVLVLVLSGGDDKKKASSQASATTTATQSTDTSTFTMDTSDLSTDVSTDTSTPGIPPTSDTTTDTSSSGSGLDTYPPNVKKQFVSGCKKGGGSQSQCKCTINRIEKKYNLIQFLDFINKANRTGKFPPKVEAIVLSCRGA